MRCKIAVTGGPSGGKTTFIEMLARDMPQRVAIVPEAASILYRGGFPRKKIPSRQMRVQKAIYAVQKELEGIAEDESIQKIIICDRGSLDGLAYWPSDSNSFFNTLNSSIENECLRYDWVIHLDTARPEHYETENPIRTESHSEALALNEKTKSAWSCHPRRIIIPNYHDFFKKMSLCIEAVKLIDAKVPIEELVGKLEL